jgi:hypothetical protein
MDLQAGMVVPINVTHRMFVPGETINEREGCILLALGIV